MAFLIVSRNNAIAEHSQSRTQATMLPRQIVALLASPAAAQRGDRNLMPSRPRLLCDNRQMRLSDRLSATSRLTGLGTLSRLHANDGIPSGQIQSCYIGRSVEAAEVVDFHLDRLTPRRGGPHAVKHRLPTNVRLPTEDCCHSR